MIPVLLNLIFNLILINFITIFAHVKRDGRDASVFAGDFGLRR